MNSRLIMFTSLPRVGGHSTLTYGLCRLLRPYFDEIEVWCKVMPEHGHSDGMVAALEEMGCRVVMISDLSGKINWRTTLEAVASTRRHRPAVFFTLAMRHLSVVLGALVNAPVSVYYHITHDLNAATIKRLKLYSHFFNRMVFICPATYEDFPGAVKNSRFTWAPQSSSIPVTEPEKIVDEREGSLAENHQPIRFGLLGRLTVEKGGEIMLQFVDSASDVCELHVAGAGTLADAFAACGQKEGKVRVKFHGAYDPSTRKAFLRTFFAGIDYLVVPSQDEWETLSMAALESLQHGVPVIMSRAGGLKSFGYPQLGPAADTVVKLVEATEVPSELSVASARPRRPQADVVAECRAYYEKHFSDESILQRWLTIVNRS